MQVIVPRIVAVLAGVWAVRMFSSAVSIGDPAGAAILVGLGLLWVVVAVQLARMRPLGPTCVLVLALVGVEAIIRGGGVPSGLALITWLVVIVAATDDHPRERALLLRVCVSAVYAFTGLAKINPSWLAAESLIEVANTRPQSAVLLPIFESPAGVVLAVVVVVVELWLAFGMWWARTRGATALLGVGLHVTLFATAASVFGAITHLFILNFGLVAMYPAFWHPIPKLRQPRPADPQLQGV